MNKMKYIDSIFILYILFLLYINIFNYLIAIVIIIVAVGVFVAKKNPIASVSGSGLGGIAIGLKSRFQEVSNENSNQ